VLEEASQQLVSLYCHIITVKVVTGDVDLFGSHNIPHQPRDREAALFVQPLSAGLFDHGVHHCVRLIVKVVDKEPPLHTNLWCGQADSRLGVHCFKHAPAQLPELAVDVDDVLGDLAEHRVAKQPNVVGGRHPVRLPSPIVPQYFDAKPGVGSAVRTVTLTLPDLTVELESDRGVFSADRIDPGTKLLLLDGPDPTPGDQVLVDLGCGYGPIGYALARRNPDAAIWAVDVNERARLLCAKNTAELGNVSVMAPSDVAAGGQVDRIWSNPPIRIGKPALHRLLTEWLQRLRPTGTAHLVVQKHLGADSLHRWLEAQGHEVTRRTSRKAYRLLDVNAK